MDKALINKFVEANLADCQSNRQQFQQYFNAYIRPVNGDDLQVANILSTRAGMKSQGNRAFQDFSFLARMMTMTELSDMLEQLNSGFQEEAIKKAVGNRDFVDYTTFLSVRKQLIEQHPFYDYLLTPLFFALLPAADPQFSHQYTQKTVALEHFYDGIQHLVFGVVTRYNLDRYCYDSSKINIQELHEYISVNAQQYNSAISDELMPYYLCYITKTIAFFLDPRQTGSISLLHLLASPYLCAAMNFIKSPLMPRQFGCFTTAQWFTMECFQQVYTKFFEVVDPQTQFLLQENARNLPFPPSDEFTRRWFYSQPLYAGKGLDFRQYMDYVLAITYPCNAGAGYFVFHVLDSENQQGYLTVWDVRQAFQSIYTALQQYNSEFVPPFDVFIDEIFQFINPRDNTRITIDDVFRTNSSEFLVRYLMTSYGLMERETACSSGALELNNMGYEVK